MGEWPIIRLGDYAEVNYGYTAKASFEVVGPKFLRITDIQDDGVDWDLVPTCPIEDKKYRKQKLQHGDIVFARTGATTGKSFLLENPPESVAASYLIRLRLHDSSLLSTYVWAFFKTYEYWEMVNQGISGSAQGGFNASKLADLVIPLPPLSEQKHIVAILDDAFERIDTAIANTEKNLANARELFESYLNKSFTAGSLELISLSEITTHITDGDHSPPPKSESGIPFITISNISKTDYTIDFSKTFKVPESYYENLKPHRKPQAGDVLYTVVGATYGIPVLVQEDIKFCFQRHIGLLRPNEHVSSLWLYYALLSPFVYKQATEGATGAAQPTVGLKVLRSIRVPKIDYARQKAIGAAMDFAFEKAQHLESIYQKKLTALTELKQSILQKAFAGELTADMNHEGLVN